MAGWHPQPWDGGIPCNPDNPGLPAQALCPTWPAYFAEPLYYSSGCDVRLRPHVLNSLISENLSILDRVGLSYQPASLDNVRTAIEYIVQRGIPKYAVVEGDGTGHHYTGIFDPPILGYNEGLVLCVVPLEKSMGYVRIDCGAGMVPVLRNDMQEMEMEDWQAYTPYLIGYVGGVFFNLGIVRSQVPLVLKGAILFWIRPDGNDDNDGMENSPQRAFRTIDGAWTAVGSRFAASPAALIIFKLGIPGTYEGGEMGPYGSNMMLVGDESGLGSPGRATYRVVTKLYDHVGWSLRAFNVKLHCKGVNFVINTPITKPNGVHALHAYGGATTIVIEDCQFTLDVTNASTFGAMFVCQGGAIALTAGACVVRGNGNSIYCGNIINYGSFMGQPAGPMPATWAWYDFNATMSVYYLQDAAAGGHCNMTVYQSNVTGRRHFIITNGVFHTLGILPPGNQPGLVAYQGQII